MNVNLLRCGGGLRFVCGARGYVINTPKGHHETYQGPLQDTMGQRGFYYITDTVMKSGLLRPNPEIPV